jgi:phenylacetate-CoA ligase
MIRLFSGDLTEVTSAPCSCGRTYRRLPRGIFGRVDDMLVVRGTNVYPHVVEDVIGRLPGVGSEYRIVIDRPEELDTFTVEVECADGAVAGHVADAVKNAVGLRPDVVTHEPGTLETTEFKSRRVFDRRRSPTHEERP